MILFDFNSVQEKINSEIISLKFDRDPKELYDPVTYFLSLGGKRIRPLLSVLGCYLYTDEYNKAIKPSIAIELFHNFTLIHDDIMDKAPLRRGKQTIHEKWNNNIALLAGDVTLIEAYELLENVDPTIRSDIFRLFNLTAKQVCEGQQFDMNFEKLSDVSIDKYIEMITLKTAVLLGFSMYMGSRIGGSDKENAQKLYEVAKNIGISFQIKDDYLDVFGEQQKVGKFVGGDIVSNKKTFLLLTAIEKADKVQLANLNELISVDSRFDKTEKISKVVAIYKSFGIEAYTKKAIDHYFVKALNLLDEINAEKEKKEFLKMYFIKLMERES